MSKAYVALALVPSLIALAIPARAICGRGPDVEVSPTLTVPGPANTQIRLAVPADWVTPGLELTLRRAPTNGRAPESIAVKRVHSASGTRATEVLAPAAPLAPGDYEVWAADPSTKRSAKIVAALAVDGASDTLAPTWGGVRRAEYRKPPVARGKVITMESECGEEIAAAFVEPAKDDRTPASAIRFAVWTAAPETKIDYDAPPLLYAAAIEGGTVIRLGSTDGPSDFSMGAPPRTFPKLRVGMRAVDLAGNRSAASEFVLE